MKNLDTSPAGEWSMPPNTVSLGREHSAGGQLTNRRITPPKGSGATLLPRSSSSTETQPILWSEKRITAH